MIGLAVLLTTAVVSAEEVPAITAPAPDYDAEVPALIAGVVFEDTNADGLRGAEERGVPGVSVSDGFTVVATNEAGRFELTPSSDAVFVALTRPPGYDVQGSWYAPLAEEVNFALVPTDRDQGAFTFVHVSDNHLSDLAASREGLTRFVDEVNSLSPAPALVFNTGDLVNCSKQLTTPVEDAQRYFDTYAEIMGKLRVPWYNVAGDHSDVGYRMEQFPRTDFRCGKAMYWEHFGPHYFSFEYGNLHIVSIDAVYKGGDDKEYNEKRWGRATMLPEHLDWLRQDLERRSPGTIVLTGSENPLNDFIPGFEQMAVSLQLVGDTHVVSFQDGPVPSRTGGALSGTWWKGACADLSPQGYMIYRADGDQLDHFYKGLGRQIEIDHPRFGARVSGEVAVQAHLAQGDLAGPLQFRLGHGDWRPMQRRDDAFYRENYEGAFDSTALPDGIVQLTVRAADGAEERTIPLVIDNSGADLAAPADATLVIEPAGLIGLNTRPRGQFAVLFNGSAVATVGEQGRCEIAIPAERLQRVNSLRFEAAEEGDAMTMMEPHLIVGDEVLSDPRQAAIREVRLNHWTADIVERAGTVVGPGRETSFGVRQDEFCFVIPR